MSYVFHPAAMQELDQAVDYYNEHGGNALAQDFLNEVYRVVEMVHNNPGFGASIGDQQRRYAIQRFPYSIIFGPIPQGIRVLAIEHHKQRPAYWQGRK